jgi:hypothetical protein
MQWRFPCIAGWSHPFSEPHALLPTLRRVGEICGLVLGVVLYLTCSHQVAHGTPLLQAQELPPATPPVVGKEGRKNQKNQKRRYPLAPLRQDFSQGLPLPVAEKLTYEIRFSRFPIYATVGTVTFENLGLVSIPRPVEEPMPVLGDELPPATDPTSEETLPMPPAPAATLPPLIEGLQEEYRPRPGEELIRLRSTATSKGILLGILGIGVQDRFETLVHRRDFTARLHLTEIREGKRHRIQSAIFDPEFQTIRYQSHDLANPNAPVKIKLLPRQEGMLSLLSALYFVRLQRLREGQMLVFPVSDDEENYQFEVLVAKSEKIKTNCGEVKAIRLEPQLFGPGRFFNRKGEMVMWLSRDRAQVPLRMVARTTSGTVSANLLNYRPNCQIQEPEEREQEMIEPDSTR